MTSATTAPATARAHHLDEPRTRAGRHGSSSKAPFGLRAHVTHQPGTTLSRVGSVTRRRWSSPIDRLHPVTDPVLTGSLRRCEGRDRRNRGHPARRSRNPGRRRRSCSPTAARRPPRTPAVTRRVILATIRHLESGDDYQAQATGATASGAYQYIDATWRYWADRVGVDTAQYPQAWMAPATYSRTKSPPPTSPRSSPPTTTTSTSSPSSGTTQPPSPIPRSWTVSRTPQPATPSLSASTRPVGSSEYQSRVRGDAIVECTGVVAGTWAFPLPVGAVPASALDDPHHDYPAIDLLVPEGTPVFAITGGTVATVQTFAGNWWTDGCNTSARASRLQPLAAPASPSRPRDGLRHTYCHASRLYVTRGDQIAPGQHVADSGNTGRSGAPHLHLELRLNGIQLCPQRCCKPILAGVAPRRWPSCRPPAVTSDDGSMCFAHDQADPRRGRHAPASARLRRVRPRRRGQMPRGPLRGREDGWATGGLTGSASTCRPSVTTRRRPSAMRSTLSRSSSSSHSNRATSPRASKAPSSERVAYPRLVRAGLDGTPVVAATRHARPRPARS